MENANARFMFQGKTVNGEWVWGYLSIITKEQNAKVEPGYYISNRAGMPFAYQVIPETVGQCTGLKDYYGILIFDGDIIEEDGINRYIHWHDGGWCYSVRYDSKCHWHLRKEDVENAGIIGNIHEDQFRDATKLTEKEND